MEKLITGQVATVKPPDEKPTQALVHDRWLVLSLSSNYFIIFIFMRVVFKRMQTLGSFPTQTFF